MSVISFLNESELICLHTSVAIVFYTVKWLQLFLIFEFLFNINHLFLRSEVLCFDLLTRPKMPFKVVHRKEVTHPGRWKSEEVAKALRRVYITAWEFEGNIRPTN